MPLLGGRPGSDRSTLQRLLPQVLPKGTVGYDGDDEVAFVTPHSSDSGFAMVDRHARVTQDQGFGRWSPSIRHDRFYLEGPSSVEFLETHHLVASMYVLSREGEVLYTDHQDAGEWRREPFGRIALEAERGRRDLRSVEDDI